MATKKKVVKKARASKKDKNYGTNMKPSMKKGGKVKKAKKK